MISNRKMFQWIFLKSFSLKKIIIMSIIILVIDSSYLLSKNILCIGDAAYLLLQGYGQGCFCLVDLFFFVIFNGTPLYFISLALDSQNLKTSTHALLRCQSKRKYFQYMQLSNFMFLLLYFAIHSIVLAFFCIFGTKFQFGDYTFQLFQSLELMLSNKSFIKVLFLSLCLRLLELLCMQEIIASLQAKTNKLSAVFIGVICGYFSLLFIKFKYYPFGISSVIRWTTLGMSITNDFFISAITLIVVLGLSYLYMNTKGIFELWER